jgi:nucleotide-binding universal stress UspA family protein
MYDRILFPTDGSDGADAALEHAIDHAIQYEATLAALYVVAETYPVVEARPETVRETIEAEGRTILEAVEERAADAGVESVETAIDAGSPYRQILEHADEADLVVMGTHGRRGIDRYLLGSVAEKVVRSAECPVLTARADEGE